MGKTLKSYADYKLRENLLEYNFYFHQLKKLCLSMFNWSNLPDGIDSRFIEDTLFNYGFIVFYKHVGGFITCSRATAIGFNAYDNPIGFRTISNDSSESVYLKADECACIYSDLNRIPIINAVTFFAKKLSAIENTIDSNLEHLKNPYIIACPEGQKQTVQSVYAKKESGVPLILTTEEFRNSVNNINLFDTKATNHLDSLLNAKEKMKNEFLTYLGINNINVLKKERLTSKEGSENDEQISINRNSMLVEREKISKVNKMFDCDIKVEFNTGITNLIESEGFNE